MNIRARLYIAITAVISVGFLMMASYAHAVTISPVRIELDADPGATVDSSFKVFNEQSKNQTLYISFARFETKDETGEPAFVPGKQGIPSWVKAPASITATAKEYTTVPFTITVPKDAEPGGYFAAIFATNVPPQDLDGNNIALRNEVGTLILFRVNGDFKEGEAILDFNTKDAHHFYTSLPVEFYYRFQNSGDDRARPLGDITVRNIFGFAAKLVNANRSAGNVLPKSIRRYEAAWVTSGGDTTERSLEEIKHLASNASWVQTIRWQWEHFAFGRYSADLEVTVNNDSSRNYKAHTSFWVIPWQLLVTVLGILGIFLSIAIMGAVIVILIILRLRRKK